MLTYADVWWQTDAPVALLSDLFHICWRMLTYAYVWWQTDAPVALIWDLFRIWMRDAKVPL